MDFKAVFANTTFEEENDYFKIYIFFMKWNPSCLLRAFGELQR